MDRTEAFEIERPRLLRIATRVLGGTDEAEDVVQTAWLRLHDNASEIENLPGWLTTVTTRLCLDRLRARAPRPYAEPPTVEPGPTPDEEVLLADTVGVALQVVLDRLAPRERVAFVLHDSFGIAHATVAEILGTSPANARQLASRARTKVAATAHDQEGRSDRAVVDAFLAAARQGDFTRLLALLAPDAVVVGDAAAVAMGTPSLIEGREPVATFFDGAAKAAFPARVDGRPGAAWIHHGETRVAFDFTVVDGLVVRIAFRADPDVLASVERRERRDR
ncbi:DNA-directed RNA polymerase sigma-70 factor [Marmoricola endophyticus]|uniref:DNA-directed RNA polymerase sigma-70 factor n=1 Tax=Marmoricola endophyticus TaxID=2040280 RepID=A0A917BF30_9ACTN|nr:sigma-70 family RNA polymerase sigma factor [Marmoricola endophyticus]GGF38688.1 DNA-directed RNA polymerase sigma-70 factor [Marmoricola endophyticus]